MTSHPEVEDPRLLMLLAPERPGPRIGPRIDRRVEREVTTGRGGDRLKRACDILVSALVLLVTGPLLLLLALLVATTSRGPVFFRQTRVGAGGTHFVILKFRSMRADAEQCLDELRALNEASGPLFKMRHDPRVTRVGAWMRRYSLDELPQLINVLTGSMSLVGPRPALPDEVAQFSSAARRREQVRPGLTGLAQVSGRSDLSWEASVRLDLDYLERRSARLDLWILLRSVPAVVCRRGAY